MCVCVCVCMYMLYLSVCLNIPSHISFAVQRESESDIPELQVEALYLPRSSVTDLEVIGKG